MSPLSRSLTLVAAVVLATSGCTGARPTPNSSPGSSGPTASGPGATEVISNLPDLGFKNVKTETAAARGAVITAAGGTITATGSNGAIYTLVIPSDAMPATTQIAIYPITSVANLPGGAAVSAGVQITPDGIQLRRPATFTIQFPTGTDPKGLGGLLWTGDADNAHPYPLSVQGQTVTMHLFHFTAPTVTPTPLPLARLGSCADADAMETWIGSDVTIPDAGQRRSALTDDLRDCYRDYVAPAMQAALAHPLDGTLAGKGHGAYDHWIYALVDAASAVGSPDFAVAPEDADAKAVAISLLHAWYEALNQACVAHKDDPDPETPVADAILAISLGWQFTHYWGLDTVANGLDQQTLLDRLCVQVVIAPSPSYTASGPGTTGDVSLNVGITVAGGQVRFEKMHITLTRTGTGVASANGFTDPQGNFTAAVPWPGGVDPIQIDIRAELDFPEFIFRLDRITKQSGGSGTPAPSQSTLNSGGGGGWYIGPWQVCNRLGACFSDVDAGAQQPVRLFASVTGDWSLDIGCLESGRTSQSAILIFEFRGDLSSFTATGVGSPLNSCPGSPTVKGSLIGTTLTLTVTGSSAAAFEFKFRGTLFSNSP